MMVSIVIFTDHWHYNSVGWRFSTIGIQWLPSVSFGEILLPASILYRNWHYRIPDIILRVLWSLHGELHYEYGGKWNIFILTTLHDRESICYLIEECSDS